MATKTNTRAVELTNDQAIDAIYAISNTKREPFKYQKVGRYGIVNPGTKDWTSILTKLERKTRTKEDIINHTSQAEILDRYNQNEAELFDLLSDWSRFAIIIPDYKSAPALIADFLGEFGGEINIHTKPDYQAIHWHGVYKDVNVEFQFHTEEYTELKKATDAFYHQWKDIPIEKNSKVEDDYNRQRDDITKYCQIVYGRSDFMANLFNVQSVVDAYQFRQLEALQGKEEPNQEREKLSHFCMYAKKAEIVQNELADYLPEFLTKLSQMEKTELIHDGEQQTHGQRL